VLKVFMDETGTHDDARMVAVGGYISRPKHAKALGHRTGENPALWRGHLKSLLPKRQKLTRGHHPAMPYADVADFLTQLRAREAVAALALEFTILTAVRSGEALGAMWSEIDAKAKVWTIPKPRMKAGKEHRVPLSARALAILEEAAKLRTDSSHGAFIFPGQRRGRPLSGMTMEMLLRRMKIETASVHGFRSSFRDWAGEHTAFPREVAEEKGQEEVRQSELKSALQLDKSAVSRRVADALDAGFLKNLEDRKGRPARLVIGDALPDNCEVLPTPEQLVSDDGLRGCTVDPGDKPTPSGCRAGG
jgi:hypothetical protein